ncbi:HEAT repeat domain-containing protein [Phycisphaerales bacterium AB-hyl4]|uniref:HEAT repeat domain-containing protein n=1 Tax=Natronomicrosphaera hydrolytica TaxID=3242702 RepID=A0ABV4U8K1_9BACT
MSKCEWHGRGLLFVAALVVAMSGGVFVQADDADDLFESLTPAEGGLIDLPMYRDPAIETPEHPRTFHPRLQSLWLAALEREESSTRLEAARAFYEAAGRGMENLNDAAARLIEVVRDDDDRHVVHAAVEALRAMGHAEAAEVVLERAQASRHEDLLMLADRALAEWDHEAARSWWLSRLDDGDASRRLRVSAVRSLGQVGASDAAAALRELALDASTPMEVRLTAGEALGRIAGDGLVDDAEALAAADNASVIDRLVAVRMLAGHGEDAALALAEQWTADEDATVARRAMANLNAHDLDRAAALAVTLLSHADANVRLEALQAVASQQSAEAVQIMAEQLDDVAPAARTFARRTLEGYDEDASLSPVVREQLERVLNSGASWRALEQAGVLATLLDHKPTAERLAELLTHDRAEVRRAAANAMRVLSVEATLPAIAARAEALTDIDTASDLGPSASEEVTQLFHAIGQLRYEPADETLRRYIPKNSDYSSVSRSAAIWALGRIHEGESRPELARALVGRVTDQSMMDPESEDVQRFSAIALGRMDAADHVDDLRRMYRLEEMSEAFREACRWAVRELTGEELDPLPKRPSYIGGWFIEPVD